MRCPTYGVCFNCMCSGPVRKKCHFCKSGKYLVMRYCTDNGVAILLDAKWISRSMMMTKHKKALDNRQQAWVSTPIIMIDLSFFVKKFLKMKVSDTNPLRDELRETFKEAFNTIIHCYPPEVEQFMENQDNKHRL